MVNTALKKKYCRRKNYQSGDTCSQIDYVLIRRSDRKRVKDIGSYAEECAPQHRLVVCDLTLSIEIEKKRPLTLKPKIWRLKDGAVSDKFREKVEQE